MLDVAIGVIFVYLLLSLVSSAINELIEAFMKQRAVNLEAGIRQMIVADTENTKRVRTEFESAKAAKDAAAPRQTPPDFKKLEEDYVTAWLNKEKSTTLQQIAMKLVASADLQNAAKVSQAQSNLVNANNNLADANTTFTQKEQTLTSATSPEYVQAVNNYLVAQRNLNDLDKVRQLYQHPLIDGLFAGDYDYEKSRFRFSYWKKLPSYIPSGNFALALIDTLAPIDPSDPTNKKQSLENLKNSVATIQNEKLKNALLPLINAAGDDIDDVRRNIEDWYDNTMDRVSGVYKRRVQYFTFFIGVFTAIAVNADTISIVNGLVHDPGLRTALIATIPEYIREHPNPSGNSNSSGNNSNAGNSDNGESTQPANNSGVKPSPSPAKTTNSNSASAAASSEPSVIKAAFVQASPSVSNSNTATAPNLNSNKTNTNSDATTNSNSQTTPSTTPKLSPCEAEPKSQDCKNLIEQCQKDPLGSVDCKAFSFDCERNPKIFGCSKVTCAGKNKDSALCKQAQACEKDSGSPACNHASCAVDPSSADCKLNDNLDRIQSLGLPIGWQQAPPQCSIWAPNQCFNDSRDFLLKLLGWLITGIAISLGAPFWFDLLNKFMIVRSTVKPTEKSPPDKSKD